MYKDATFSLNFVALPSGYRFKLLLLAITAKALGLMPRGFSLLASFIIFFKPNSFLVCSIGLPGSYGFKPIIPLFALSKSESDIKKLLGKSLVVLS